MDEQPRPFDPERYSPTTVEALLRLPTSNARTYVVASALGWFKRLDGSSERLRSGKDAAGTLITQQRLPLILEVAGISLRRWQEYVKDWTARYLAHRCAPGRLFLFARPLYETCPACGADIPVDHVPPTTMPNHGPGFAAERGNPAPENAELPRSARTTPAHAGAQLPRSSGTEATQCQTGLLPREIEGLRGSEVSDLQDLQVFDEGFSKTPRSKDEQLAWLRQQIAEGSA